MPSALGGELPPALVVFQQKPDADQERLADLGYGSGGQAEPRRDHVQPVGPFGHGPQVRLLDRPQPEGVDPLQLARPPQVSHGDVVFRLGAAHPAARLEQPQGQPGRPAGPAGDLAEHVVGHRPPQGTTSLPRQFHEVVGRQPRMNLPHVGAFLMPLPPLTEQIAIARSLKAHFAGFNAAISRAEREIALLREYRTTLTADVVTGKLDTRDAVKGLPTTAEPIPAEDGADAPEPEEADE